MDKRLSLSKSSKISKPSVRIVRIPSFHSDTASASAFSSSSTAGPPPRHARPPTDRLPVFKTDMRDFRRVVQELTGTPSPSTSPSPAHEASPRPNSRLRSIAPPPLRARFSSQEHLQHPLSSKTTHSLQNVAQMLSPPPPIHLRESLSPAPSLLPISSADSGIINDFWTHPSSVLSFREEARSSMMPSSLSPLFPPPVENIESILGHRAMVTQLPSPSPPFRHASESAYPQPNLHSTVHQDHYPTTYRRLSPSLEKHEASLSSPWERFLREVPSSDMQLHIRPLSNTFIPSPSNLFPLSPFPGCRSPNAFSWLPPWPPSHRHTHTQAMLDAKLWYY